MELQISIIIPTLNEAGNIKRLIRRLRDGGGAALREIWIADGGSSDETVSIAREEGAKTVQSTRASRPVQMNFAAKQATGNVLYFVHADTLPPLDYVKHISSAIDRGADFGCFRFRFDSSKRRLRLNSWCTRLPFMMFRGGDQTLFVRSGLFDQLEGFDENHPVMEDYDIIRRGKRFGKFAIMPSEVLVSSRKYAHNGYVKVNLANFAVFTLYYFGVNPEKLKKLYINMINHPTFSENSN